MTTDLELLAAVADHIPLTTTVWELPAENSPPTGLVLRWANQKAMANGGAGLRNYIGHSLNDIPLQLLGAPSIAKELHTVALGGKPEVGTLSLHGRVYRTYISLIRPLTVSVILEDCTEEYLAYQRLAANEQHLRLALDAARAGVWYWDLQTDELQWDSQMMKLFELEHRDFGGTIDDFWRSVHEDDRAKVRDALDLSMLDSSHPYSVTYRNRSGRFIAARGVIVPRRDVPHHFLGVCMDVTEQMDATVRLARQAEDLKRSNEDLESFAFVASHDLQEPLRMITNFVKILEEDYGDKFDAEGREYLDFVVDGAARMGNMIRGLLAFSRVGRDETFRWALASEAIDGALANLGTFIIERRAQIHVSPMPAVFSDQMMLTLLFQNLIGNSLKFRSEERDPVIHIDCVDTDKDWTITVKDNGEGFDMMYADRVFMIFQRLNGTKKGTGIGLAVCKKIVERHGGTIRVDSAPGVGTTITFTLVKPEGPPRDFRTPQSTPDPTR